MKSTENLRGCRHSHLRLAKITIAALHPSTTKSNRATLARKASTGLPCDSLLQSPLLAWAHFVSKFALHRPSMKSAQNCTRDYYTRQSPQPSSLGNKNNSR